MIGSFVSTLPAVSYLLPVDNIDSSISLSDHRPVFLNFHFDNSLLPFVNFYTIDSNALSIKYKYKYRWDKCDCFQYYSATYDSMSIRDAPIWQFPEVDMFNESDANLIHNMINHQYDDTVCAVVDSCGHCAYKEIGFL